MPTANSLAYLRRIAAGLIREREGRAVPSIVFTKGRRAVARGHRRRRLRCGRPRLDRRHRQGPRAGRPQGRAAKRQPRPAILFASPDAIATQTRRVLDSYGKHPGHVFNLGHGISQYTSPDHVSVLVDTVRSHSRSLRKGAERGRRRRSSAADARRPLWNSNFVLRQAKNCCTGLDLCTSRQYTTNGRPLPP